jgi:hypothetical protein
MNYDKQKPLTQEEIDYINSKNGVCVIELTTYPKGYIHVEIGWDLPIRITRNEDEFYFGFDDKEQANKENYWVVYPDQNSEVGFDFEIKQFKNIDAALGYAIGEYKRWLELRLKYLNEIT